MTAPAGVGWMLIVVAIAFGCNESADKASEAPPAERPAATTPGEKAIEDIQEAARSVRDYTYAQKDQFVDAAKRELEEIEAEMGRLRQVVERSSGAARDDAEGKLEIVSAKWAAAKAELDRATTATEATWEEIQAGFRNAHGDLKRSVEDARRWLSEQIQP